MRLNEVERVREFKKEPGQSSAAIKYMTLLRNQGRTFLVEPTEYGTKITIKK
jgi:hypothetical protein